MVGCLMHPAFVSSVGDRAFWQQTFSACLYLMCFGTGYGWNGWLGERMMSQWHLATQQPYWSCSHAAWTLRMDGFIKGEHSQLEDWHLQKLALCQMSHRSPCVSPGVNVASCTLHPSWFAKPFQSLYNMQVLKLARTCKRHQNIDWVAHFGLTSLWLLL